MKKALSALLALTLLLSLAACGAAEPKPAVEATAEVTTQATTEATTEATAEATEPTVSEAERLYGLGVEALESGDANAAYEYFEAARAHDETNPSGWLGLAELLIRDYDFEGAESLLTEALEKTGKDPLIAEKLGMLVGMSIQDSDGKLLKMNGYDENGMLLYYHIYTYRGDGKQESVTCYDASGNRTSSVLLEYDDQGRCTVGFSMEGATGAVGRVEYVYDEASNIIEERHYSPGGELKNYIICEYNGQRQRIRRERYEGTQRTEIRYYHYDAEGQLEREDTCDANDVLRSYMIYIRDEAGRITEYQNYGGDGTLSWRMVCTFDQDGDPIREEYFDGEGNLTMVYEYE